MLGRVEVPAEPVVRERSDVADDAGVNRRNRHEQRDAVEPADEPAEAGADGELAVLVQRSGDRIVARQLAEDERDEEHPDDRDDREPEVGRPARSHAKQEQRVDADHRRQVRERNGEVREQAEHAIELWLVAQVRKPRVIVRDCRGCHRSRFHSLSS